MGCLIFLEKRKKTLKSRRNTGLSNSYQESLYSCMIVCLFSLSLFGYLSLSLCLPLQTQVPLPANKSFQEPLAILLCKLFPFHTLN